MPHLESQSHERVFDFFRRTRGVDVDWVKLQVYGKDCVPEEFPDDSKGFREVLDCEFLYIEFK